MNKDRDTTIAPKPAPVQRNNEGSKYEDLEFWLTIGIIV